MGAFHGVLYQVCEFFVLLLLFFSYFVTTGDLETQWIRMQFGLPRLQVLETCIELKCSVREAPRYIAAGPYCWVLSRRRALPAVRTDVAEGWNRRGAGGRRQRDEWSMLVHGGECTGV